MAALTIGLPVYNGEKSLARALENLLAQTFGDFVVTISDNASTDATGDICREYVKRDHRIRYFRQPQNIVWSENFRSTLVDADTPYFMWTTHDDNWHRSFAEANIAQLEANPGAICSVSKIADISPNGHRTVAPDSGALTGTPAERLKTYFFHLNNCGRLYGVYRTDALKASFPTGLRIYGADWLVVGLTLLHGDHVEVDAVLLERDSQPDLHYLRRLGQTDLFEPDWRDRINPMWRFNKEMRERLPSNVWKSIRPAVFYVNLRQMAAMAEYRIPAMKCVIRALRNLGAELFHRRWRKPQP